MPRHYLLRRPAGGPGAQARALRRRMIRCRRQSTVNPGAGVGGVGPVPVSGSVTELPTLTVRAHSESAASGMRVRAE